ERTMTKWSRAVAAISRAAIALSIASMAALLSATATQAQGPKVSWIEGPTTVDLGDHAQVKLGESYMFANARDTRKLMEYMQNPPGNEIGLIAPKGSLDDWFMVFEYAPIGFVKDDEKANLDP